MAIKLEPGVAIVTVIGQENLSDGIVGQKQIFNPSAYQACLMDTV